MKLARYFFLLLFISGMVNAEGIEIVGQVDQSLKVQNTYALRSSLQAKSVTLLKLHLSADAQRAMNHRVVKVLEQQGQSQPNLPKPLPTQVQLGMNNVPVFDQGTHGTCVTFASTAAIDAALGKGDYVSQLCSLVLGQHLENNSYMTSGWNGSWIHTVLNQMDTFGLVSKRSQRELGCGGLHEYPLGGDAPQAEMALSEYHQMSEEMPQDQMLWSSILEPYQIVLDNVNMDALLEKVKLSLTVGDRLIFGVMLLDFDQGIVGAVGKHHTRYDTWVLTPEIAADMNDEADFAGHAMVITGYDDNATVTDEQGRVYKGLLTLRNSWSDKVADKGNFYMTYDYFKALSLEVQRIRLLR